MLFYIQGDSEYFLVRRRGRFSMEVPCAQSSVHRKAAVREAVKRFVLAMNKRGFQYVDDGNVQIEPGLPHIDALESVTADLGPLDTPDPANVQASEAFERAEKARQARDLSDPVDMVDFRIIATFRKKASRVLNPKVIVKGR